MKRFKKIVVWLTLAALALSDAVPVVCAAQPETQTDTPGGENPGETAVDTSGMLAGADADIKVYGIKTTSGEAGEQVTISFNVSANDNSKYSIKDIQKVCPVISDTFPFETTDEAYKIVSGTGTSLACSYTFQAKDTLETGYYPTDFMVIYGRKSKAAGEDAYADQTFYVNKSISVKIKGKPEATTEAATETEAADGDITMTVKDAPEGTYGKACSVSFTVESANYNITSVTPVISDTFPFETDGDAYKSITSKGTKKLSCKYKFKVREDVATGYMPVTFNITYIKNKKSCTLTRSINVNLIGKKQEASTETAPLTSTPRLMVTGYDTSMDIIRPNSTFTLTLYMKNTSKKSISNIKITLSTAEGEFLPVSGASTAFLENISPGATQDISFEMKAASGLSNKPYQITVKSEYEDSKANPFTAEDSVSIPVTLEDRVSVTDIMPPEVLSVYGSGELSFTINNLGGTVLGNVSVKCEGADFSCEESFVGNIASGGTGYASVVLNGTQVTSGDGKCKIIISYENAEGETKKIEEEAYVYVSEQVMEEPAAEEDADNKDKKKDKKALPVGIAVFVVAAVIVVFNVRKKKKLAREEEELMDDDVL